MLLIAASRIPGRTQIVKLTMAYQMSVVTAVERWADWAEAEARTSNNTVTPAEADLETFRRILQGGPRRSSQPAPPVTRPYRGQQAGARASTHA